MFSWNVEIEQDRFAVVALDGEKEASAVELSLPPQMTVAHVAAQTAGVNANH